MTRHGTHGEARGSSGGRGREKALAGALTEVSTGMGGEAGSEAEDGLPRQ